MSPEGATPPGVDSEKWEGFQVQRHVENSSREEIEHSIERAESIGASIKFDIRWNLLYPERSQEPNAKNEQNYKEALEACARNPNQRPTIILDSPPGWISEQLTADKDRSKLPEQVEEEYRQYAQHVATLIKEAGVTPVMIQVMNEVNNAIYNKMSVEQLGHLCRVTREVFSQKFGESTPLIMLNILPDIKYAKSLSTIKESFDVLGVDWYQGTYPGEGTRTAFLPGVNALKTFSDVRGLKEHFDEFLPGGALEGKMVAVSEVGAPTPLGQKHERMQRGFYNQFLRNFHLMLNRYEELDQEVPLVGVAFYSLEDEPERPGSEFHSLLAPIERLVNKYLESKWGIFKEDGTAKGRDASKGENSPIRDRDETLADRILHLTQERFSKRIKTAEGQKEEK
jgi:hypothetical protein